MLVSDRILTFSLFVGCFYRKGPALNTSNAFVFNFNRLFTYCDASIRCIPFRVQIAMAGICRMPLTPVIIAILYLEDNAELNYTMILRNAVLKGCNKVE